MADQIRRFIELSRQLPDADAILAAMRAQQQFEQQQTTRGHQDDLTGLLLVVIKEIIDINFFTFVWLGRVLIGRAIPDTSSLNEEDTVLVRKIPASSEYVHIIRGRQAVFLGLMDEWGNPRVFWTEDILSKIWQENSVGLPVQAVASGVWFEFSPFDRNKAWFSFYKSSAPRDLQIWYTSGLTTGGTWSKIYDGAAYLTDVGLGAFTNIQVCGIKHDRVADNHLYIMVCGAHSGTSGNRGYLGHSTDGGFTWSWTGYPDNANGNPTFGFHTHSLAPSWKKAGRLGISWEGLGGTGATDEIILASDDFGATFAVKIYKDVTNSFPIEGAHIAHYEDEDRFHHLDNVQNGSIGDWNYHTGDFWATKVDLGFGDLTIEEGGTSMPLGQWTAWDDPNYWIMIGKTPTGAGDALVRTTDDGDTWLEEPGWDSSGDWVTVEVNLRRTLKGELICVGLHSPGGGSPDVTFIHFGAWGGGHFGNVGSVNYAGNIDDLIKNNVQSGGGSPEFIGFPASIWFDRTQNVSI